ncbi:CAP domain-containing protein [Solirubrobacter sp. CPCC 204708]|uniref:CAP domain-containing protein n=1 Tax=Solirubrobacter deserti TaxID=2282478 RepID=A0ABT4RQR6_9ACTN|nr:CAP domain-containing protein [Solirubrobacter deserti]MBE2320685.1 CAP domain-containing protein [Solirubrobacter deserti]MDA0140910.1 CAP domain-containing protein [Solirubrobacter deserti]
MSTTARRRPLIAAAVSLTAAFSLHAGPAHAARGADRCPAATTVPTQATLDEAADAVVCLVNAKRSARGLEELERDADLAQAARAHSRDMARHNYFDHTARDGDSVGDRVRKAGYGRPGDGWNVGENLGWGTGDRATPLSLVNAWLASSGHRENMLKGTFRELGVGVAAGAPKGSDALPGATYTLNLGVIR